jgi:hypothetical protein
MEICSHAAVSNSEPHIMNPNLQPLCDDLELDLCTGDSADCGGITDIETGPDGYLYLLTFHQSMGSIFRIVPQDQ